MIDFRAMPLAALLLLAPAVAGAQQAPADQPPDKSAPASLQGNKGTQATDQMGATGWNGPHRGQTSPGNPAGPAPTPSADKQPPVATGADLAGPPMAFPSNTTPE